MSATTAANLTSTIQETSSGLQHRVSRKGLKGKRCLLSSFHPKLNIQIAFVLRHC